ncbi:MAG: DsbA family protein, partial [Candidatus Binatia bacterium]
ILGKHSVTAAQAAECAGEQGKFWEYHDRLFVSQGALAFTQGRLKGYARELGLENSVFSQCLDSGKYFKKVDGETAIAAFLGARGTPAFFLNGQLIAGAQPFEVFEAAIEKELKKASASGETKP